MAEGNRSALKWAGIGCGAVLLIGVAAAVASFFVFNQPMSPPLGQAHGFFADLRAGDYASALARTNASYQSTHTLEAFQAAISAVPSTIGQQDVRFPSQSGDEDSTTVSGSLVTPAADVPVTVQLSRAGEHWYIDSVIVRGETLR